MKTEGVAPSLVWKRGEGSCILNDAGSGQKRKLGNPKELGRPSADKARWTQYDFHQPVNSGSGDEVVSVRRVC